MSKLFGGYGDDTDLDAVDLQSTSAPPPERILRLRTVLDRTGFSKTTLYRKIAEGTFPRQTQISTRCTG